MNRKRKTHESARAQQDEEQNENQQACTMEAPIELELLSDFDWNAIMNKFNDSTWPSFANVLEEEEFDSFKETILTKTAELFELLRTNSSVETQRLSLLILQHVKFGGDIEGAALLVELTVRPETAATLLTLADHGTLCVQAEQRFVFVEPTFARNVLNMNMKLVKWPKRLASAYKSRYDPRCLVLESIFNHLAQKINDRLVDLEVSQHRHPVDDRHPLKCSRSSVLRFPQNSVVIPIVWSRY
jgi:hypothetical protein